jgi:putative RNA 2'-phosphotransferase
MPLSPAVKRLGVVKIFRLRIMVDLPPTAINRQTMPTDTQRSKFLSLVLRHNPKLIGLELDEHGWADIDQLIANAPEKLQLTKDDLLRIVQESDKQRFAIDLESNAIRANQGHSIQIDLGLSPQNPPQTLYHGTATRFMESITRLGLIKGKRHHVHLSGSIETAQKVGKRHGELALLKVDALRMQDKGYVFYCSDNGVWLTDHVPSEFLARMN